MSTEADGANHTDCKGCFADSGHSQNVEHFKSPAEKLQALLTLLVASAKAPSTGLVSALGAVVGKWLQLVLQAMSDGQQDTLTVDMVLGENDLLSFWQCSSYWLSRSPRKHLHKIHM